MTHNVQSAVRVGLIEDDDDDYVVTRDLLHDSRHAQFLLDRVSTYDDGVAMLERGAHDVYLIDYRLGAHTGLELLLRFAGSAAPMVMLTGQDERDVDLEAMRAGAMDYLVKGQIDSALLERSIRYSIARKRSEESLRRKDEFLAMLGHELRNPLAPIRTALHILDIPQAGPASIERAKEVMHRQVEHLVRIVDDLLDVSRIILRRIELRKEATDLMSIVRHAADTAEPLIEARGHRLDIEAAPEAITVLADPVRLAQAMTNLLTNAANHSEKPGLIRLTIAREDGHVVVRVRDWGVGIPTEFLPSIFDVFVQGERTLARSQGGLGIGLSLVKAIVELHGGTVSVTSDGPGCGSEFALHLPSTNEVAVSARPTSRPAHTESRHILVVDDNVDAAESLSVMLRLKGHRVDVAHDGFAAVDRAKQECPDVILLDIGLPGRDGYEVARLLRGDAALARTRIIALTGYGQREDQRRAAQAGMDVHLTKPVDPARLEQVLQDA